MTGAWRGPSSRTSCLRDGWVTRVNSGFKAGAFPRFNRRMRCGCRSCHRLAQPQFMITSINRTYRHDLVIVRDLQEKDRNREDQGNAGNYRMSLILPRGDVSGNGHAPVCSIMEIRLKPVLRRILPISANFAAMRYLSPLLQMVWSCPPSGSVETISQDELSAEAFVRTDSCTKAEFFTDCI